MTINIAVAGKSGSGKTTICKSFLAILEEYFPNKSILLFDNDLSGELANSFGLDIRNTIYGIRSGKHEYKTGIPENVSKQEYVEWAMEDIIVPVRENVDIIVSWLGGLKDCRCPITEQINLAIKKIIKRYDFVIFDCEFDLKYLTQLADVDIDLAVIITNPTIESIILAQKISNFSAKYATGGQLGVVINKVKNQDMQKISETLKQLELDILGAIPFDECLDKGSVERNSQTVTLALKQLYTRLNLPQENNK